MDLVAQIAPLSQVNKVLMWKSRRSGQEDLLVLRAVNVVKKIKMLIKVEVAEYFVQLTIRSWHLYPSDNTAAASLSQVT